jgi:hypothetical protein
MARYGDRGFEAGRCFTCRLEGVSLRQEIRLGVSPRDRERKLGTASHE